MRFVEKIFGGTTNRYDKSQPAVARVTQYVLDHGKNGFSVASAAESIELNGIGLYPVARILRQICLEMEDDGSLERLTTIGPPNTYVYTTRWELNTQAYSDHISYESAITGKRALCVAWLALFVALLGIVFSK